MILTAFRDRTAAGKALARRLERYAHGKDVVVLGLPRGGMPVAFEIAKALRVPLDAFLVGKLGYPGQPELAFGAVTSGGIQVLNHGLLEQSGLSEADAAGIARRKIAELRRKEAQYRQDEPAIRLEGRTVILVDDGAATGASMRAAIQALRMLKPKKIVAAFPVASTEAQRTLQAEADETVSLQTPEPFYAVGQWYEDFDQVSDDEVVQLLETANSRVGISGAGPETRKAPDSGGPESLRIQAGGVVLHADLTLPREAIGLVLFAHGSGSSRKSIRNRQVARFLGEAGFATLLMDLLTAEEEAVDRYSADFRFDIELLAERLMGATRWAGNDSRLAHLKVGYFGASTGAAAALMAAARIPGSVGAVVSRGGRPDLAGDSLADVAAPTLLIVGGEDETVLDLNRHAMESMHCLKRLEVVPGATHLFEEPGALEEVTRLARDWFGRHLQGRERADFPI